RDNYYTVADAIVGEWHGRLAEAWGLTGEVQDQAMDRLAEGRHPISGDVVVQSQRARTYTNADGEHVRTMEHRAAWDATFSAPKSVSVTALVGGDARVAAAHRASVRTALDEMERYVQARIGGTQAPETTRRWIAATFEHDSARPVEGYAAPQLHTHVVIFNVTERTNGETRALQPRELYRTQAYATALYRSDLAARLSALGYEIERGASGQPEIRGYTAAYLEASSPRRRQIQDHLAKVEQHGAAAAQIAAHQTRESKRQISHAEMQRRHRELAARFGDEPARVVEAARARSPRIEPRGSDMSATVALTFAKNRNFERAAVVDERALLRDALKRSMGDVSVRAVRTELEARLATGEFLAAAQPPSAPGRALTTRDMIALERETIAKMRVGQETQPSLGRAVTRHEVAALYPRLNESQRAAVLHILENRDRVVALEGVAGSGKTTALAAVREVAQRDGYIVEGLAPASRAAQKLADAGIPSTTLQRYLARGQQSPDGHTRLYVLDESSLASTTQMHQFLQRLGSQDRVLLVGDVRQHQAVEAGRPYQQLQEAGIRTIRLDIIVRQQDPSLKQVVEELSRGDVPSAIRHLDGQGRVHQIANRDERFATIAREYARDPDGTLVVSADNQTREEINQTIHRLMQGDCLVDQRDHRLRVLVPRSEMTGADRQWAQRYEVGDVVRYTTGSKAVDIQSGESARVEAVHADENLVTVRRDIGERITYDPRRLQGVTVYREVERAFAVDERVQTTAPCARHRVANRELGRIDQIDPSGHVRVQLDSGRNVRFDIRAYPHLDYGYAVTSHSSQGQTADRVLVHVDTARAGEQLVNRRLAYVAV
ncbi:MAG TPA: MobF family relaxase, partial [Candidatus Limnocylindria bacterium]|nr:MobF family relaxase [Candidatus Limnocylindria bacterium]